MKIKAKYLIPGKLYTLDPDLFKFGSDTSMQVVNGKPTDKWVVVNPSSILMFVSNGPSGAGALISYFLAGDKLVQWWSHSYELDFRFIEEPNVDPG